MPARIREAVARLAAGGVVAFPTETVYGLGGDATNDAAIATIFALKGRPTDHPLIVHIARPEELDAWSRNVPASARALAERFWPGPLTLILEKSPRLPASVTGGQDTVGLRCPSHRIAQQLLRAFAEAGSGVIAAPSANKFGHLSPTTAAHVRDEFGSELFVLDGGACEVGLESTIVDLSRGAPVLLRPGAISREELAKALGEEPRERDVHAPRASGTLAAHYAPRAALYLADGPTIDALARARPEAAVLAMRDAPDGVKVAAWIVAPRDPSAYGHDLYANLRRLDASGAKRIVVEAPPPGTAWEAVNDRLKRAAAAGAPLAGDEP
jgi:L-threonylcarbamoyladenylate synthase